jgi:hypothetical protein
MTCWGASAFRVAWPARAVVIMGKLLAPLRCARVTGTAPCHPRGTALPAVRVTGAMPAPPIVASARRCAARRALDGRGEPSGASVTTLTREPSRTGKGASRLDMQIAPLRNVTGDLDSRARRKTRRLGTRSAGAGAATIRLLRRPWLAGQGIVARIEQAQIDQGRGQAGALHPGVVAAGTGCRRRNSAHSREHKPCHGR